MNTAVDTRALALPLRFERALTFLVGRLLGSGTSHSNEQIWDWSQQIIQQVFSVPIVFGQLALVTNEDIRKAIHSDWKVSAGSISELLRVLPLVIPWTPVCNSCGEFPLKSTGGIISQLEPGSVCPNCIGGNVLRVPILLRRVHWVTGELIDPEMTEDFRARPGFRIPLTDQQIRQWVEEDYEQLIDTLASHEITLDRFLAYVHLDQHMLSRSEDARTLLQYPSMYGITTKNLSSLIERAKRFVALREVWNIPCPYLSDGKQRSDFWSLMFGQQTYLIEGLIGRGAKCDVFRGRWDHNPTQFGVIKLLAASEDRDLFDREIRLLQVLHGFDDMQSEYCRQFVPQVLQHDFVTLSDNTKVAGVLFANTHQFDWTLIDVRREYPNGVHPRHGVWMTNRLLELLKWFADKRIVHGAITPDHLLLRAEYHRLMVLDWSYAGGISSVMTAWNAGFAGFYPEAMREKGCKLELVYDLQMACRNMLYVLGGNPEDGSGVQTICSEGKNVAPLVRLLYDHAGYDDSRPSCKDVHTFTRVFGETAGSIYGPPKFIPFFMPAPKA